MDQALRIKLRNFNRIGILWLFCGSLALSFSSCAKKEETEEAKQITFTTSGPEYVLPNSLKNEINADNDSLSKYYTCDAAGTITAPRVRIRRIAVKWDGTDRFLPLMLRWRSDDPQLKAPYTFTLSAAGGGTITSFFGISQEYMLRSDGERSNENTGTVGTARGSRCYMDMGSLPALKKAPTGAATVTIRGTLSLVGLVEDSERKQTPVIKEVELNLVYFPGSVTN